MPISPIILIQLLGIPQTAQHRKKQLNSRQNIYISFAYPRYGETNKGRLKRYFFSDTVFNLSGKVLTDTEIVVLEKGLENTK